MFLNIAVFMLLALAALNDIKTRIIPPLFSHVLIAIGIVSVFFEFSPVKMLLPIVFYALYKVGAMGGGDAKVLMGLGMLFSQQVLVILGIAVLLSGGFLLASATPLRAVVEYVMSSLRRFRGSKLSLMIALFILRENTMASLWAFLGFFALWVAADVFFSSISNARKTHRKTSVPFIPFVAMSFALWALLAAYTEICVLC
ncbi:MAG: prepilin peptidase [DPANN group archaeon]|nr:prepilin peptidase [DPANN group archaeon]